MSTEPQDPAATPDDIAPDAASLASDPEAFRKAHAKYGSYLKQGGLPFEPEELTGEDGERASELELDAEDS